MRHLITVCLLASMAVGTTQAQVINENFVDGVYWNPQDAPSMGFAVSVQKGVFFGAIYGYDINGKPSFVTLLGQPDTSTSLLDYRGVVFVTETDGFTFPSAQVGEFTWTVDIKSGQPAATLTISNSTVLRGELDLVRFAYNEADGVDLVSESEWIGFIQTGGQLFAYEYSFGARSIDNGMAFVPVGQRIEDVGTIIHGENGLYGLLAPFSRGGTANGGTDIFYSCYGTNTQLYCVSWILAPGQSPADFAGSPAGLVSTVIQQDRPLPAKSIETKQRLRQLQLELNENQPWPVDGQTGVFNIKAVMSIYRSAGAVRDSLMDSQGRSER